MTGRRVHLTPSQSDAAREFMDARQAFEDAVNHGKPTAVRDAAFEANNEAYENLWLQAWWDQATVTEMLREARVYREG